MLPLFYLLLFTSTMLAISSASWMMIWMSLEINLISFIPLLAAKKDNKDSPMKYFMVQTLASAVLLMGITLHTHNFFLPAEYIISLSLLMKLGIAPFHSWLPSIMKSMHWKNNLMLVTWQKIAPFFVLMNLPMINYTIFIATSAIMGSVGGYNQTNLKKIMAYSSIGHMAWLLIALSINENLFLLYFIIYIIITSVIIAFFTVSSLSFSIQLFNMNNTLTTLVMMMSLLSLGGLPPFLGFYPKWQVIKDMMTHSMFILSLIMIASSLITLFYYLRITYFTMLMSFPLSKNRYSQDTSLIMFLGILSLMGLPLMTIFTYKLYKLLTFKVKMNHYLKYNT